MTKSNGEIKRLGRKFQNGQEPTGEDLEILLDWAKFFATPMQAFYSDLCSIFSAEGIKSSCRVKRLESILCKNLRIKAENQLSTMGDIAGIRIIAKDMAHLKSLRKELERRLAPGSFIGPDFDVASCKVKDYIESPSLLGYRSVHFRLSLIEKAAGKRFRLELQLRTLREHAWAQAVETVGAVRGIDFKHNPPDGFFKALGDVLAVREGSVSTSLEKEAICRARELDGLSGYSKDLAEFKGSRFQTVSFEGSSGRWHVFETDAGKWKKSCERFEDLPLAWESYRRKALANPGCLLVFTQDSGYVSNLYRAYNPSEDVGIFDEILEIAGAN